MMRCMTMHEAMTLADSLEVSPETIATNGMAGEVQFIIPKFTVTDAQIYVDVVTAGLPIQPQSITISDAGLEDECGISSLPTVTITIKTEN